MLLISGWLGSEGNAWSLHVSLSERIIDALVLVAVGSDLIFFMVSFVARFGHVHLQTLVGRRSHYAASPRSPPTSGRRRPRARRGPGAHLSVARRWHVGGTAAVPYRSQQLATESLQIAAGLLLATERGTPGRGDGAPHRWPHRRRYRPARCRRSSFRAALAASTLGPILADPIEGMAQLASTCNPERASRLLGAATALRERQAVLRPPVIRQRFDKIKAVSELHLDPAAAQRAWQQGRRMTTQEALDYARNHVEP